MKNTFPDAKRLAGCYPPPSKEYEARFRRTLTALPQEEEKNVKRKFSVGLALALLVTLIALGALAAALSGGVLSYLFFGAEDAAPQALSGMVAPVNAVMEQDGIRLTVTDGVCDGERLALSFTVENTDPARRRLVEVDSATFNGAYLGSDYETLELCWLPAFTQGGNSESSGMMGKVTVPADAKTAVVTLTLAVSQAAKPLVMVDDTVPWSVQALAERYDPEYAQALWDDLQRVIAAGDVTIADQAHQDAQWWLAQGYTPVDRYGMFLCEEDFAFGGINRGYRPGQMTDGEEMTLTFTLDVSAARAATRDVTPAAPFRLSAGTFTVTRAVVSPLSILIDYHYQPDAGDQAAAAMAQIRSVPALTDHRGEPLELPDMYGESWLGGRQFEDGSLGFEGSLELSAPSPLPEALGLSFGDSPLAQEILEKVRITLPAAPLPAGSAAGPRRTPA